MNDSSSAFNPADAHARRRVAPHQNARPPARWRPGAIAAQAAPPGPQACARGELACRAAWLQVVAAGVEGILALPRARAEHHAPAPPCTGSWDAVPLASIAAHVEHALAHGVGPGTARAMVLLAAVAAARFNGAAAAMAVADAALTLVQETGDAAEVTRLHAALMGARYVPFAACLEAYKDLPGGDVQAVLLKSGLRFGAGVAIPELILELTAAQGQVPADPHDRLLDELAARLAVLRALATPSGGAVPVLDGVSFGAWTSRLELAFYGGDRLAAGRAVLAAPLAGALVAPADLLRYHLFAVLVLASDPAPAHRQTARWHRAALDDAASACAPNAGAMAALAGAAELAGGGDVPGALRGYEAAATCADLHGQTWVAALAWELAAALCQQCAFGAATPAYRRRALMAWHACGAHGRIAQLCQGWNDDGEKRAPAAGVPCGGQVDHEEEARRVARAGAVGELGVSIAHEVNQPLAAILLQAAAARRWLRRPAPDLDKALDAIEQIAVSGRRAGDIVRSVQGLARRHANDLTVFPVDAALEEVLRLLSRSLRKHSVTAELALGLQDCQVHANRAQVQQVVINLVQNAIDALATVEGRPRHLVVTSRQLGPNTIDISVADNGPGVAPADRAHIFSALFSTKANGTGVGLSISRAIAEAHGGHLECRPQLPHGAVFSLVLPSMAAD